MATNDIQFAPALQPAEIIADFDVMQEKLDGLMEPYKDMDDAALAKMELKELKGCRADVNAIINSVEDGRKAIKRIYNEPLAEFEGKVKKLLEPALAASEQLADAVSRKQDAEKQALLEGLRATYEDCAPALVPVVPFERILEINPKWANKSDGAAKAAEEIIQATAKIARDWEALKKQADGMAFFQEAEREFFRTLDIGKAIEYNVAAEHEQAKIDALKAEVDANRQAQEPVQEQEPIQEPEETIVETPKSASNEREYLIRVTCTTSQVQSLISWLKAQNIHGTYGEVA